MCSANTCHGTPRHRSLNAATLIALAWLCALGGGQEVVVRERNRLQYCSFFSNRPPKAQPGLRNCTWFKENSCCLQQEIEATFGRVKPLKGASPACQRYINYLMCYICAPNQNVFYQKERLTVCGDFCDRWYGACKKAILKGSIIGELYESGSEFCRSRRFLVSKENCFYFDMTMDTTSSGISINNYIDLYRFVNCVLFLYLVI
ncbi:hypothetical protein LSH36_37g16029 [Paralvinella palmiformis]|uniref:Folate receptor-like domain-containing protein n=1 Tax=Paralvinella palmiformis TaxID=53620 RepID=A0AAD9K810_9ANNE|nr:hypothetical protein LSH36_37g16029 [Paralvinella palmiformis]